MRLALAGFVGQLGIEAVDTWRWIWSGAHASMRAWIGPNLPTELCRLAGVRRRMNSRARARPSDRRTGRQVQLATGDLQDLRRCCTFDHNAVCFRASRKRREPCEYAHSSEL